MANDEIEKLMRATLEAGLRMRKAQRAYFDAVRRKQPGQEKLVEAKRLEVNFDYKLAELGYR